MDRGAWQATWDCKELDTTERLSFTQVLQRAAKAKDMGILGKASPGKAL